ncbi:hypothetical protein [Ornithinimicrobium panacihumi]|uniref:hypothetical protein n=1 Tax=Ornithinimicrobium panacihumi TaxID=2008449 RepID=UPI003F899785
MSRWQLSRSWRKAWLLTHVITSVGWLGAGATNLVLAVSVMQGQGSAPGVGYAYQTIHLIDAWIVIPAAFAALISGIVLSLGTPWGLFRHWWVVAKLVLTLAVILFSTFGLGVWVEMSQPAAGPSDPTRYTSAITTGACMNMLALTGMTALSIYKPKGLTPHARGAPRQRGRIGQP